MTDQPLFNLNKIEVLINKKPKRQKDNNDNLKSQGTPSVHPFLSCDQNP